MENTAPGAVVSSIRNGEPEPQISHALIQAYLGTAYSAKTDAGRINSKVGVMSEAMKTLFVGAGVDCAAFITAENPFSEPQTPEDNAERQRRLEAELTARRIAYYPGQGQGEDPNWPAEASFLVLGMGREAASDLGRKYGQNAIVWVGSDGVPELVLLRLSGQVL